MVYKFSDKQKTFIKTMGIEPEKDFDDDESEDLLNTVADHLMDVGFDKDYKANEVGEVCEDIISTITKER